MPSQIWISKNEDETDAIADEIASFLRFPAIVLLTGNLGAGKTALTRALLRSILQQPDLTVPSPTYTFVQTYGADDDIWHFDLYRLPDPADVYDLGWEDALSAKLCLIEWPSKLGRLLPKNACMIDIEVLQDDTRRITVTV